MEFSTVPGSAFPMYYNQLRPINHHQVARATGGTSYEAKLDVFDPKTKKILGQLEIKMTIQPGGSVENRWKWGNDSGPFTWMQWGMILYSNISNPPSYVWSLVNHTWAAGNAVPLPRKPPPPWFKCKDKIAVVNEGREPPIRYEAKPISESMCCKI